ncbi:MAG: DUF342 domain-containing protein [Desulfobacterales bacterium]|nr:DUF342 domain-containing protein [Desulfobacterales bacterium]
MIVTYCPYCIAKYKANDDVIGKSLKCKKCDLTFKVSIKNRNKLPFIAEILLSKKLIKEPILSKIIFYVDRMRSKEIDITIEEILINKGGVSSDKILEIYKSIDKYDKEYGEIAKGKNFVTKKDVENGLQFQQAEKEKGNIVSLGKILINDEAITKRQHLAILEIQNERSDYEQVLKFIENKAVPLSKVDSSKDKSNEVQSDTSSINTASIYEFAMKQKILTKKELDNSLTEMKKLQKQGVNITFEDYLVEKKLLNKDIIDLHNKVLLFKEIRKKDKYIAQTLLQNGTFEKADIENALKKQLQSFTKNKKIQKINDILGEKSILNNNQIAEIEKKLKSESKKISEEEQQKIEKKLNPDKNDIPKKTKPDVEKKDAIEEEIRIIKKPELIFSNDRVKAYLHIPEIPSRDIKDTVKYEQIERLIIDGLVKNGLVDDKTIRQQINKDPYDEKKILIATGTPAIPGKNAIIKTYFQEEFLDAGKVDSFGMIDFRDRGEVPQVKKDDLIAEKFPLKKGIPGKDIFGQAIPVEVVTDEKLGGGTGTYFSSDNLKLYAKVNGQPTLVVGKIEIYEQHEIKGDVDYSTGHVKFNGNIKIPGKILSGFKVKGVNIEVSDVEGGIISATGDVTIKNGIIGGTIITKGSVIANFISDASINALGNVIVNKQLIDSKISTSGTVSVERGQISNCQIVARKGITANEIGTNHSKPCRLAVGRIDHIDKEIQSLRKADLDNREKYEQCMNDIKSHNDELKAYHNDIIALTKKQNKNLEDEKESRTKIKQFEGSGQKDKLVTQEAILKTCVDKIKKMDQRIKSILKDQDKPIVKVAEMSKPLGELKAKIDEGLKELAELEKWISENPGIAIVNVGKHLNEGTFIAGTNSEITIETNKSKCTVKEIQLDNKKDSSAEEIEVEMEMIIE